MIYPINEETAALMELRAGRCHRCGAPLAEVVVATAREFHPHTGEQMWGVGNRLHYCSAPHGKYPVWIEPPDRTS